MSAKSIAARVITSFDTFCIRTSTKELGSLGIRTPRGRNGPEFLADYIEGWLRSGHGVRACHGNFPTYLVALTVIIDYWLKNPGVTAYMLEGRSDDEHRYIERRVTVIFGNQEFGDTNAYLHRILSPDFFAECVFSERHGGRRKR
jgi:hypothetical protein